MQRKMMAGFTLYTDKNISNDFKTGDIIYDSIEYAALPVGLNRNLYIEINDKRYKLRMSDEAQHIEKGYRYCLSNGHILESNVSGLDKLKSKLYSEMKINVDKIYRYRVEVEELCKD